MHAMCPTAPTMRGNDLRASAPADECGADATDVDDARPCPECEGMGTLFLEGPRVAGYNSAGAPYPEQRTVRCPACRGSGEVRS